MHSLTLQPRGPAVSAASRVSRGKALRAQLVPNFGLGLERASASAKRHLSEHQVLLGYWVAVASADFINDWLLAGVAAGFRPVGVVATEVVLWWSTWILATPLLLRLARRFDPGRIGWKPSLLRHAVAMSVLSFSHVLITAALFALWRGDASLFSSYVTRFVAYFSLAEAFTYWGFLVLVYWRGAGDADGRESRAEPFVGPARRLMTKEGDRIRFVRTEEIDWITVDGNYVELHVGDKIHLRRATLSKTLEQLDSRQFVRIHRSSAVNVDRISEVQPWFGGDYIAILEGGKELRVSRRFRDNLLRPAF